MLTNQIELCLNPERNPENLIEPSGSNKILFLTLIIEKTLIKAAC